MTRMAEQSAREGYRHWDMVVLGWKYNMSNVEAALLLPQFERMEAKLARRHALAARYDKLFSDIDGISLPSARPNSVHARHLYTIWCEDVERDELLSHLHSERIGAVVNYRPIHLMSYFVERYGYRTGDFPIAEAIGERTVSLPFYPDMPLDHVDGVAEAVERCVVQSRRQHSNRARSA
jgi:UDP-4-amino-4-deoxy-L-arabinose-oxoglutarate aminotransferase